jgi:hypothetical protein
MDFGFMHPTISCLVARGMAQLSRYINTNEVKELVFSSDSEEQCTSNVYDIEHRT